MWRPMELCPSQCGWSENYLNFSESGWWGRILSAMKVLIPILIGLLVAGCGKSNQTPNTSPKETASKGNRKNNTSAKTVKESPLEKTWIGKSMEKDGGKVPKDIAMRMRFRFSGDKLFMRGNFDDGRDVECSFHLDEKQKPNHIDFTPLTNINVSLSLSK